MSPWGVTYLTLGGLAAASAALYLVRVETANGPAGTGLPDGFGAGMAAIAGWTAFGFLILAGIALAGLIRPVVIGALALVIIRATPLPARPWGVTKLKLPLALVAVALAAFSWFGVIILFGGL